VDLFERDLIVKEAFAMQRYGSVIGVKPEAIAEYKKHHAAVWPEVLEMIRNCNIRNYSIFLKDDLLFGIGNTMERIFGRTWRKWRLIPKRRSGGRSWGPCSVRFQAARRANGGPAWKKCFTSIKERWRVQIALFLQG